MKVKPYESPIIPFENFFRPVIIQVHGRAELILPNARTQPQLNVAALVKLVVGIVIVQRLNPAEQVNFA